jgi:glycosyl transferase family 25
MIPAYVINLARDTTRLANCTAQAQELGFSFERVEAVEGKSLSSDFIDEFRRSRPRGGRSWLHGQIGCFMSHFRVWETIAAGDSSAALVLEDDLHFSKELGRFLQFSEEISGVYDIIRLEVSTTRLRLGASVAEFERRKVRQVKSNSWCAGAYLISKSAAIEAIERPTEEHSPTDEYLFNLDRSMLARKLKLYQVDPALCIQDKYLDNSERSGFASNIELGNRPPKPTAWRAPFRLVKRCLGYRQVNFVD